MATTNKNTETSTKTTTTKPKADVTYEKEIAALKEQIELLKGLVQEATSKNTQPVVETKSVKDDVINPNKKVKVVSLTYGCLSLWCPARGMTTFKGFGDVAVMTFGQLFDYMGTCRNAAKNGYFFIADADVVEEFGLTEDYKKILSYETIMNVINGSSVDSTSLEIFGGIPEAQKDSITRYVAELVYNRSLTDLNKIDMISNKLGANIMQKVEEMRSIEAKQA